MIESRYLKFDKVGDTGKTEIWDVLSKSSDYILGQIKWYVQWRQYCFFPSRGDCVFNVQCMSDISSAIKELMAKRA